MCEASDCERTVYARGLCGRHYKQWHVPLARPVRDVCQVEDCPRGAHSSGYCRSHARRLQRHGDVAAGGPLRDRGGGGSLSHGYWYVVVPADQRHLVPPGRTKEFEHRLVMARTLGRPLLSDEVVHHRNGDRLDNRPENLELWTTAQPKGQRVEDKVAFAMAVIARYEPEVAHALGLDLDPCTGEPRTQRADCR